MCMPVQQPGGDVAAAGYLLSTMRLSGSPESVAIQSCLRRLPAGAAANLHAATECKLCAKHMVRTLLHSSPVWQCSSVLVVEVQANMLGQAGRVMGT